MANENVLVVLQEAVRSAIYEAANEEIKKHREQFEQEMQKTKRELVSRMTNQNPNNRNARLTQRRVCNSDSAEWGCRRWQMKSG